MRWARLKACSGGTEPSSQTTRSQLSKEAPPLPTLKGRPLPTLKGKPRPLPPHLYVIVRVPVGVIDDDGVGGGQVDPQTPSPGGEQENELGGSGSWGGGGGGGGEGGRDG